MVQCDMHDTVETGVDEHGLPYRVLPYRCSHCKGCFCCQHKQEGYDFWICIDGSRKPATYDPGVRF